MSEFLDLMRVIDMAYEQSKNDPPAMRLELVQRRVIQEFGGARVYVPARETFVMGARFDLSGSPADVMRRYRVSRATAFRLLKK
jgi:hypothetical protein